MNQPTDFQLQYPLNKTKKFWKKMIGRMLLSIPYLIVLSILTYSLVPMLTIMSGQYNTQFQPTNFIFMSLILFLGLFIVLTLIYSIYYKAYINRYYYECGQEFITIKKNVFTPTEIHVQYQKIQDVYVDQDLMDRIFGLYDVHIASATVTSGIEAHIDGVNADVAESLKNIILSKIRNVGNSRVDSQIQNQTEQPKQTPQFQSNEKISSQTYPISESWVYSATSSAVIFGLILTLLFTPFILKVSGLSLGLFFLFLLFIFIFAAYLIYLSIWKKNYYFEFMPDYILLRTGVITREEKHMPYKSIQNITNFQAIVDKMLGLSDVKIENAATKTVNTGRSRYTIQDGISLVWQPKEKADELAKILNDIVSKINPQNLNNMMGL